MRDVWNLLTGTERVLCICTLVVDVLAIWATLKGGPPEMMIGWLASTIFTGITVWSLFQRRGNGL